MKKHDPLQSRILEDKTASLTEIIRRLFFKSNQINQVIRRMTVDTFKSKKNYFKINTKFDRKPM